MLEQAEAHIRSLKMSSDADQLLADEILDWLHRIEASGGQGVVPVESLIQMMCNARYVGASYSTVAGVIQATAMFAPHCIGTWLDEMSRPLRSKDLVLPPENVCCGLFLAFFETGSWIDHVWKYVSHRELYHKWWRLLLEIIDNPALERLMVVEGGRLVYPDKAFPGRLSEAIKGFIRPRLEGKDKDDHALVRGYQVKQLGKEIWNRGDDKSHKCYSPFAEMILNELAFASFGMWIPACKMAVLHIADKYWHDDPDPLSQRELNDRLLGDHNYKPGPCEMIVGFQLIEQQWKGEPSGSGWDTILSSTVIAASTSYKYICLLERQKCLAARSKQLSYHVWPIQIDQPGPDDVARLEGSIARLEDAASREK